jgi:hypothetical protein
MAGGDAASYVRLNGYSEMKTSLQLDCALLPIHVNANVRMLLNHSPVSLWQEQCSASAPSEQCNQTENKNKPLITAC